VAVDQPRARRAGVTSQDVAISLQTALSGFETTQYREGETIIPVTLRSTLASRTDVTKLDSLNVYAQATGTAVPLLQVADASVVWEPSTIRRRNRLKTVTVSSELAPGVVASDVVVRLRPWLDAGQAGWPPGYRYELGGEAETSVRANQSIVEQLPVAGLIILLLLVGQFNSIRRTAIILLTIPLGLIGVVAGLLLAQSYVGFMTLLGIIALAGIIINNAIVLIDRIRIEIYDNGLDPPRAIVEATQGRFRPILLTTATTVAGLLPLWFGGGPMWEPMAIAIIFGLLGATVLTLGVVPVLYSLFFRVRFDRFSY
ncbi:MAG: efflux RND transporter permease subunit, partial [Gammaproteobacteria bacterium]|nr:efflux RND transporter permease subunit [Gammaproteobacteria bacterium]